jgi:pimeloyl-ACP methyl ester carboxylesterase
MSVSAPIQTLQIDGMSVAHAIAHPAPTIPPHSTPIVMLHGWGAHSGLMWGAGQALAARGWQSYIPDLPGFGATPPPPSAWGVYDYAAFVRRYLNAHDLTRVHLIGHSFGGRLALILGADHADCIAKIALADSAGVPPKPSGAGNARLTTYKAIRDTLYRIGARTLADRLREWYSARYGSADYRAVSGVMRETLVRVVSENLLPYAARVRHPTLLFWGDQDADTPLWMGKTLEQTIPDAGLVVFEGAGHYAYLERTADFARIVDHFFGMEAD